MTELIVIIKEKNLSLIILSTKVLELFYFKSHQTGSQQYKMFFINNQGWVSYNKIVTSYKFQLQGQKSNFLKLQVTDRLN